MRRLVFHPLFCLAVLSLVVLAVMQVRGRFVPEIAPDTVSYTDFNWATLESALSQPRTFGYPLFLKLVEELAGSRAAVPVAHWGAMALSVCVFYWGLREALYSRWTALFSSAALLLGSGQFEYAAWVLTDSLGFSLAVAATGFFMAAVAPSPGIAAWGGLAVFTFLAYQVRPVYLCLIPLWPALSLFLDLFLLRRDAAMWIKLRRMATMAAVVVIPFAAFCTLRWGVVGHWGLVSFGGHNIVGVAGQFLDENLAKDLPAELQPLARKIIEGRARLNAETPPTDFATMLDAYNPTIHEIAIPAAQSLHGADNVAVNCSLSRLSREVLRRRPAAYGRWLLGNARFAVKNLGRLLFVDYGTRLALVLLFAAHGWSLLRDGGSLRREAGADDPAFIEQGCRERHLLFWTALAFAAAKVGLVILVEPAIDRYLQGAAVLLPCVVAVWAAHYTRRVFPDVARAFDSDRPKIGIPPRL